MSENPQESSGTFTLPDNFISQSLILGPTQFLILKIRVQEYNTKFDTDLDALQVANCLNEQGHKILAVPTEEESYSIASEVSTEVQVSLNADWKNFVSKELQGQWEKGENIENKQEAERLVNILLGAEVELGDEEKKQYDFIIDYIFCHKQLAESYKPLSIECFQNFNNAVSDIKAGKPIMHVLQFFEECSHTRGLGLTDGVLGAYLKGLSQGDDPIPFIEKLASFCKYVEDVSLIFRHPRIQKASEENQKILLEQIIPEMKHIFSDGLDENNISEHMHISYVLVQVLRGFAYDMIQRKPHEWHVTKLQSYIESEIQYRLHSVMLEVLKDIPNIFLSKVPSYNLYNPKYISFNSHVYNYLKDILLHDTTTIRELFLEDEIEELGNNAKIVIKKQDEEKREEERILQQAKEEQRLERLASKNTALQYMFEHIEFSLRTTKGNIQKLVQILKEDKNLDFNQLIQKHQISAIDMVEFQLKNIEDETGSHWKMKNDPRWQKVCSVLAEYCNLSSPKIPHFFQENCPASCIALSILRWDVAEMCSHLPANVYEKSMDSYFQNVCRIEAKRKQGGRESSYDNRATGTVQKNNFYNHTSATPAWWLTPNWKKLILLKDEIWSDIKKSGIRKEDVMEGFNILLAQCERQGKGLDALTATWVDRLSDDKKVIYTAKKEEFDTYYNEFDDQYKEVLSDEFEIDMQFRDFMNEARGEGEEESDLEKCFRLKGELDDIRIEATAGIVQKQKNIHELKEKIVQMQETYKEQFVWTTEQRQEKIERERRQREEDDRDALRHVSSIMKGGFY